jgi:hypothetical protein
LYVDEILLTGSFEGSKTKSSDTPISTELINNKSWKQLYLERNLQEFLENMQAARSLLQELHILDQDPESEKKDKKQFELELLNTAHELSRIGKSRIMKNSQEVEQAKRDLDQLDRTGTGGDANVKPKETTTKNEEKRKNYSQLHSHRMRPNLNYYLLHANAYEKDNETPRTHRKNNEDDTSDVAPKYHYKIDLPESAHTFKGRLKNLFDGSESRNASRLNHLTTDDDVFTFYNNAIYKSHYKYKDSGGDLQYWLLSKDDTNLSEGK